MDAMTPRAILAQRFSEATEPQPWSRGIHMGSRDDLSCGWCGRQAWYIVDFSLDFYDALCPMHLHLAANTTRAEYMQNALRGVLHGQNAPEALQQPEVLRLLASLL